MLRSFVANLLLSRSFNSSVTFAPAQRRLLSSAAIKKPRVPIQVTFPQVRRELSEPHTVLIDVREPAELPSEGRISENAKNIPLGQLEAAFQLEDDEFQQKYGFKKPSPETTIVTHCKLGIRATKAAMALTKAGYENVIVYPGIVDWVENGGNLLK